MFAVLTKREEPMADPESWLEQFHLACDALPRLSLGTFPTPVHSSQINGNAIWIKDDSACSPVYGGNKVRKLEFLLADARERGNHGLVVWGDSESHTVAAIALFGISSGFQVDAVVFPYRNAFPTNGEKALATLKEAGVDLHQVKNMLIAWWVARRLSRNSGAALVPLGATTPLACVGYVLAALELARQIEAGECPCPDQIYVAMGTAGTVAGLLVGLAIAKLGCRVVAVRTVERIVTPEAKIRRLVSHLVGILHLPSQVINNAIDRLSRVENRYLGAGYRDIPPSVSRAIQDARDSGLELESCFTGKTMACLLNDAAALPNCVRLFWNTHDRLHQAKIAGSCEPFADTFL